MDPHQKCRHYDEDSRHTVEECFRERRIGCLLDGCFQPHFLEGNRGNIKEAGSAGFVFAIDMIHVSFRVFNDPFHLGKRRAASPHPQKTASGKKGIFAFFDETNALLLGQGNAAKRAKADVLSRGVFQIIVAPLCNLRFPVCALLTNRSF